ncbi:hypothetical protein Vau01_017240 [Virgisporangium aurantiacum]|uniref:DUF916 domain-containing protein n=1 Tax=Virgisporangium aurantiacum TaxID=175570 RepID=A0A8J4DY94_9ACTN|nr:hypothetical protein Vau01_017240 [Virgisporangium aurantiacum]
MPSRTAALLIAALVAGLVAGPVAAPAPAPAAPDDDGSKWSVLPVSAAGQPPRNAFDYRLKPGEQVTDHVSINNLGTTPLTVAVYATDAFNSPDGAYALLTAAQEPRDIGTWVTLAGRDHTVPPRTRLDIPFTLRVPANAAPGDHSGGIVASITTPQTTPEGQTVNVERRVGTRLHTRVNGPVRAVARISAVDVRYDNPLNPFGGGGMTVTYRVVNEGNVRLKGKAVISVDGPFGVALADSGPIDVPELLPDSEVRFTRRVEGIFPAGPLSATVRVNAESAEGPIELLTAERSVWAMPWLLLAVVLIVVLGGLGFVFRRPVRRLLRRRPTPATATVLLVLAVLTTVLTAGALLAVWAAPAAAADPSDSAHSNELRVTIGPATSSPTTSATPTPTPTPTVTPTADPPTGPLPRTGYSIVALVVGGAGLVAGGAGLRLLVRRRTNRRPASTAIDSPDANSRPPTAPGSALSNSAPPR